MVSLINSNKAIVSNTIKESKKQKIVEQEDKI
jgi:hypothetical protein